MARETVDFYLFTHVGSVAAAVRKVEKHSKSLAKLLMSPKANGILIVYVASAQEWKRMVSFISETASMALDKMKDRASTFLETEKQCTEAMKGIYRKCPRLKTLNRVRLLSPWSFRKALRRVESREKACFVEWFKHSTYDFPKLVDAIIRLRVLGTSCPVLRFDHDVLFPPANGKAGLAEVGKLVSKSIDMFRKRQDDTHTPVWYFSGQYVDKPLSTTSGRVRWRNWNGAFATRATPALLCTNDLLNSIQFTDSSLDWVPEETSMDEAVNEKLLCRFYGLERSNGTLASNPVAHEYEKDISSLGTGVCGANPLRSCVSGAGLCVSGGVTVDIPPFNVMRHNVMWIDDDIMVRLISHLKRVKPAYYGPEDTHFSSGHVEKHRGKASNVAWYTLEKYMPSFVFGTIFDAWLYTDEDRFGFLEKFMPEKLAQDGVLVSAMKEVIEFGKLPDSNRMASIRRDMQERALDRIKDVYYQLRQLKSGSDDTFASLWATGAVAKHSILKDFCRNRSDPVNHRCRTLTLGQGLVKAEWHERTGVATAKHDELPSLGFENLNTFFAEQLDELLDDTIGYLKWMLVWPSVVQAIRSESYGESPVDILYRGSAFTV